MDINDYDKTLFFAHRLACDDLTFMMDETDDDLLSKKIERFVNAFLHEPDLETVDNRREDLLYYLDHVFETQNPTNEIIFS
jgi:hypothetical protein